MRRLLWAAILLVALAGCGQDRPEGAVERWLIAISNEHSDPSRYAPEALTEEVASHGEQITVVEVGRVDAGARVRVPFRVEFEAGAEVLGIAEVERVGGQWKVVSIDDPTDELQVPSHGGERIGRAAVTDWLWALGAGLALVALSAGTMRIATRETRPPTSTS